MRSRATPTAHTRWNAESRERNRDKHAI